MGEDLRIKRTRDSIRKAFCKLCVSLPYKKITVSLIAEHAYINRKTFYLHYHNLTELMDDIESLMIKDLQPQLIDISCEEDLSKDIYIIYTEINSHNEIMRSLLYGSGGYAHFSEKYINDILSSGCFEALYQKTEYPQMTRSFFRAIFSIYREWDLKNDNKAALSELAKECASLLSHGLQNR